MLKLIVSLNQCGSSLLINKRLDTFDFLRGFFLFLALLEHYTFYMNHLWVGYYQPFFFGSFSSNIEVAVGTLPMDTPLALLANFFVPWVTHIYLALATFNLGLKTKNLTKDKLKSYNLKFLFLFIVFTLEKFLIGRNIGEILSPNPLQSWMIVLAVIANAYFYLGTLKTSIVLSFLGILRFLTPLNLLIGSLENKLVSVHPEFSLDIRPDIFLISGLIGFLLGHFYEKIEKRQLLAFISISVLSNSLVNFFTPEYKVDFHNVFLNEYAWSYNIFGFISICLTVLIVVMSAMALEKYGKNISMPLVNQMGFHSLNLFIFHRIYFIFLFIPFRLLLSGLGIFSEINNSFLNNSSAIILYGLLFWAFKKLRP